MELIYVDYKEALYDTVDVVKKVISFIGEEAMNEEQMKSCVDKTLYRNKV